MTTEAGITSTEDGNSAITESQVQTPAAEADSQASGEQGQQGEAQASAGPAQDGQRQADDLKEGSRAHQRVQQALRDRNAAIGYAERNHAKIVELERQLAEKGAGRPEQYRSDEEYIRAVGADAAKREAVSLLKQQGHEATIQAEHAAQEAWRERTTDIRTRVSDFEAKVHDPNLTITPVMAEAIRESELGGEIAYYLADNKAEAVRIASLPPVSQAIAIARLETRVGKSQSQISKAPAPAALLKGKSGGGSKSMEDMSFEEYRKARGF